MLIGKTKSLLVLFIGLALVLAVAVAAVAAWQLTSGDDEALISREASGPLAPDFTVPTLNGDFQLAQQRGKVTVLYFAFPN